jgi:hypothetical protein
MAIRDWSAKRIATMWLLWVLLVLLGGWGSAMKRPRPSALWVLSPPAGSPAQLTDAQALVLYGLLKPPSEGSPRDSSRAAALMRLIADSGSGNRDSLLRALDLPPKLTVAQRDSLGILALAFVARSFAGSSQAVSEAGPALWAVVGLLSLLVIVPPIILGFVTLRWYVPRVVARANIKRAV